MEENIIFLDFDGVIEFSYNDKIYWNSIKLIKDIITNYNAKIVLITSLLGVGTINKYKELTKYLNNLGIYNILDKIDVWYEGTYNNKQLSYRTLGIIDYLNKHPNINYVIFDDDYSEEYCLFNLNHIKPNSNEGLKKENIKDNIFKKNNHNFSNLKYQYTSLDNAPYIKATNEFLLALKKSYDKKKGQYNE